MSDNRCAVTMAAGVPRVVPSISEARVTGNSLRTTKVEERSIKTSNDEWSRLAVASWGVREKARKERGRRQIRRGLPGKDIAV